MRKEFEVFADAGVVHPCCAPRRARAVLLEESRTISASRRRVHDGSVDGMIKLDGGAFFMGTESEEANIEDGESPVRKILLDAFYMDAMAVTNAQFEEFANATGYVTESERLGWSFVFQGHIPAEKYDELVAGNVAAAPWWCKVPGASWRRPAGPESSLEQRAHHPVVQVSWNDARAYCEWAGKRLPTEAEWEFASRGGLEQKLFPWGDELTPGGRHLSNVWQGEFPNQDLAEDGYAGTAPVDAFPPNGYGLFNMSGNAWEWCSDWFDRTYHQTATRLNPVGPPRGASKVMRGGSYLCHRSYCNRYRVAARSSNTPDSGTGNIGFRCVRDI